MVQTRSLLRSRVGHLYERMPDELLIEILSYLQDKDLGVALCASKRFSSCKEVIYMQACAKRWPGWFKVVQGSEVPWRRGYELLSLRERELTAVPLLSAILSKQTVVNARNRAVLTEWLAEVSRAVDWCWLPALTVWPVAAVCRSSPSLLLPDDITHCLTLPGGGPGRCSGDREGNSCASHCRWLSAKSFRSSAGLLGLAIGVHHRV